jgi:hypothetical protein
MTISANTKVITPPNAGGLTVVNHPKGSPENDYEMLNAYYAAVKWKKEMYPIQSIRGGTISISLKYRQLFVLNVASSILTSRRFKKFR